MIFDGISSVLPGSKNYLDKDYLIITNYWTAIMNYTKKSNRLSLIITKLLMNKNKPFIHYCVESRDVHILKIWIPYTLKSAPPGSGGLLKAISLWYRPASKGAGFHFVQATLLCRLCLPRKGVFGLLSYPLKGSWYSFTLNLSKAISCFSCSWMYFFIVSSLRPTVKYPALQHFMDLGFERIQLGWLFSSLEPMFCSWLVLYTSLLCFSICQVLFRWHTRSFLFVLFRVSC